MLFQIPIQIPTASRKIQPPDKILLIGSCFTEHMGNRFHKYGWNVCENPHGIIFNPLNIHNSLKQYMDCKRIQENDLLKEGEYYHHWDFHSRFSNLDPSKAVDEMNHSIEEAHNFLKDCNIIFITLGTSYQYFYGDNEIPVANCHRVPANRFQKRLLTIEEMVHALSESIEKIRVINPNIQFIFTISPVRHIKDGVIENNVSKARLIETVDRVRALHSIDYFPAYELLIDVLRDYRYYDVDLVHPNFAATQTIWEMLVEHYFSDEAKAFLKEMIGIQDAYQHRTRFPESQAHQKFLKNYYQKTLELTKRYPHWDASKELKYFQT